jgi:hypothetical protein
MPLALLPVMLMQTALIAILQQLTSAITRGHVMLIARIPPALLNVPAMAIALILTRLQLTSV